MSKRKAKTWSGPNADFCEFLTELAEHERNVTQNMHKCFAYRKAAVTLENHPVRITSGDEAKKLKGIGPKIADKIEEFVQTGGLRKLKVIREDDEGQAISALTTVSGIGPVKAKELVAAGVHTIDELRKRPDLLNHHQQIGLEHYDEFEQKVPRAEVECIEEIIRKQVVQLDKDYRIELCGSYRRGKPESGDIDVLITHPSYVSGGKPGLLLKKVVDALVECSLVKKTISTGEVKFMGACKVNTVMRRLDIRLVPHNQYCCAVLYFTGSDMFNKEMRAHALEKGYTLNEYSLRRMGTTGVPGEPLLVQSEEDIFDYLEYPYKKPEDRN